MDSPVFFITAIVLALALAVALPRWVRRSSRNAAERGEMRAEQSAVHAALDELTRTVLLDCSETAARELVDLAAFSLPRAVAVRGDGGYGLRFIDEDDAIARLTSTTAGTVLQIERASERLGRPQASGFWRDLRRQVKAVAGTHGVAASDGPRARLERTKDHSWVRVE